MKVTEENDLNFLGGLPCVLEHFIAPNEPLGLKY
jgi:hypothetical protein